MLAVALFTAAGHGGAAFELDEGYPMGKTGSYIVTAMVRRDDRRYESHPCAIDVVPGLEIKTALQLFADRPDFQRKLTLVYFMRKQSEFLFLRIFFNAPRLILTVVTIGVTRSGELWFSVPNIRKMSHRFVRTCTLLA